MAVTSLRLMVGGSPFAAWDHRQPKAAHAGSIRGSPEGMQALRPSPRADWDTGWGRPLVWCGLAPVHSSGIHRR